MSGSRTAFFRGENPLRADKLNTAFSERVLRSGDAMTGLLRLAQDPVSPLDAVTKRYVDVRLGSGGGGGGGAPIQTSIVNVLDHGAVGDGVNDDTDSIQNILNTYAGKATVFVPDTGQPYMCTTLYISTGTDLLLFGRLKLSSDSATHLINFNPGASHVTIRGHGTLDANGPAQPPGYLKACINGACNYLLITGITLQNSNVWNLNIAACSHVRVDSVHILNGTAANEFAAGCDDCWITNSHIDGVLEDEGFCFYGGVTNSGAIGNTVTNAGADGINVLCDGPQPAPCQNIVIADNICFHNKGSGIQINRGVGGTGGHKDIVITGNRLYNNNVWDANGTELFVHYTAGVVITGNSIIGGDTHTAAYGIGIESAVTDVTITGNSVANIGNASRPGIGLWINSANIVNATGNTFHDYRPTSYMTGIGGVAGIKNAFTGNLFGQLAATIKLNGFQPETIASNLGPAVVNVLDFGAKGDGVTDDTAVIQHVLDANAGKATVYLPWTGNHYKISTWLTIPNNSDILLTGVISALPGRTGRLIFVSGVANIIFRGTGVLDGSSQVNWTWEQINSANVHISGITLQNAFYGNLNIGSSNKVIVDGISILGGTTANGFGIGCSNCWFTNSVINGTGCGDYAFCFYGGVTDSGIIGCSISHAGVGTGTSPPGIGILSDGAGGAPTAQPCRDIIIANNVSHSNCAGGISVLNVAGGLQSGIVITGNRCYNNCSNPVDAGSIADCYISNVTGITISGNQFSHSGVSTKSVSGIYLDSTVNHAHVNNNQIWNVGQGRTDGVGFWINGANNLYVTDNWVYDDQTTHTMASSIVGEVGTANTFIGNRFDVGANLGPHADTFSAYLSGNQYVFGNNSRLNMVAPQGVLNTSGTPRWYVGGDGSPESGGNVGSDYAIVSVVDDGSGLLHTALKITRASGKVTLATHLNLGGIPTSATGLVAGDVWRDGTGVLHIV